MQTEARDVLMLVQKTSPSTNLHEEALRLAFSPKWSVKIGDFDRTWPPSPVGSRVLVTRKS